MVLVLLASACATRTFDPVPIESTDLVRRASTQSRGPVRVRASVPGPEETRAIFGAALYDRGIQPVWIEVTNDGPEWLRFAPAGMDRGYFSPLEVSYKHRGGYTKADRARMDRFVHDSAMPRQIRAGETRSGFVFTHAHQGTKTFNVELYGVEEEYGFTFFVEVPGFVPDHADVDFDALYDPSRIEDIGAAELRDRLGALGCCATGPRGDEAGLPINALLIAPPEELLRVLLRAGWRETQMEERGSGHSGRPHWNGRPPDGVFRMQRSRAGDRNELRLWLAPLRVDGHDVWLAQITHYVKDFLQLSSLDPDVDDARNYLLQTFWYGQGLQAWAWSEMQAAVSIEEPSRTHAGGSYFTDGYRLVMWVSGTPVAMGDGEYLEWDLPPAR